MAKTALKKSKDGYNYKYVELAQIHEYLEEIGKRYYQYIEPLVVGDNAYDYIMTAVQRVHEDGTLEDEYTARGCRVIAGELAGKSNDAQEQGSGITYARRYSLLMALGLATEDDDAQCISKPKATSERIDFGAKREEIRQAKNLAELNAICGAIPQKLKQYFVEDYNKAKELLEFTK